MSKLTSGNGAPSPICEACELVANGAPTTMYVHLNDGEIVPVPDVRGVDVNETSIILLRGVKAPIVYPRSRVYFACCREDMEPPQG